MKRTLTLLALALIMGGTAMAQTKDTKKSEKTSFGTKVSKFWKKVKNEVTYTADGLFSKEGNDLSLVDGKYYMQVYDTNLYSDTDGEEMRTLCTRLFAEKYPKAEITSCALPQTEWLSRAVENDGKVVGYVQTMYCYILAKDGSDGYINAKYVFLRTKEVGKDYQPDKNSWPKWLSTDVLSNEVYAELTKKKK